MRGRPFRFYISSSLILLALTVSLVVGTVLLWTLKVELEDEIADRLVNTARLGVETLDREAFGRLVARLSAQPLSDAELAQIEDSSDYQTITGQLNRIRSLKPDLFLFVYTLAPTADPQVARFVVDADVLTLREQLRQTGKTSSAITPFNMEYKLEGQPVTVQALGDHHPVVESSFVYDYTENVSSMMGFAPIVSSQGEFLGVLGIDASDQRVTAYLVNLFGVAVVLTAVLVVLILLFALWLANRLSRPILELTASVRRLSGQDWSVRVDARSKIQEIYDLKVTFNEMADRIEAYQDSLLQTNASLSRFVPHEFLTFLGRKDITEVTLGDQTQKDMAVLVLNVRGFASLSDALSPREIFQFVNAYLGRIAPIVRLHRGFIDRYWGDGIMALFPEECDDASLAALDILAELSRFNAGSPGERLPHIEVGIGLHAGVMMLGTIGEARRIQGTVIADAVNVAERLVELTEEYQVGMLGSKEFYNRLRRPEAVDTRFIGWASLRGRVEALPLLELYGADSSDQRGRKTKTKPEFERGVLLFQQGDKAAARAVFETILRENPLDRSALRLSEACRK